MTQTDELHPAAFFHGRYQISPTTWWRLSNGDGFPAPIRFGRSTRWSVPECDAFFKKAKLAPDQSGKKEEIPLARGIEPTLLEIIKLNPGLTSPELKVMASAAGLKSGSVAATLHVCVNRKLVVQTGNKGGYRFWLPGADKPIQEKKSPVEAAPIAQSTPIHQRVRDLEESLSCDRYLLGLNVAEQICLAEAGRPDADPIEVALARNWREK